MSEEIEGQEVDTESAALEEVSAEPSSTESSEVEASSKEGDSKETTDTANLPFHEHPRFKELVEQKNQAISQQKALEERYAQMEARVKQLTESSKPQTADKDELIEHLRTIDPRLADRLEKMTKALPTVESMQQKLESFERQQAVSNAVSRINSMHDANKVSPELKNFINSQLDLKYMQGQLNLQNLDTEYKNVHEQFKKYEEAIKRTTLEGYVPAKKADAKAPTSQPKGKPATSTSKAPAFSKDPELARQQVVSRYLKMAKAESDL